MRVSPVKHSCDVLYRHLPFSWYTYGIFDTKLNLCIGTNLHLIKHYDCPEYLDSNVKAADRGGKGELRHFPWDPPS